MISPQMFVRSEGAVAAPAGDPFCIVWSSACLAFSSSVEWTQDSHTVSTDCEKRRSSVAVMGVSLRLLLTVNSRLSA